MGNSSRPSSGTSLASWPRGSQSYATASRLSSTTQKRQSALPRTQVLQSSPSQREENIDTCSSSLTNFPRRIKMTHLGASPFIQVGYVNRSGITPEVRGERDSDDDKTIVWNDGVTRWKQRFLGAWVLMRTDGERGMASMQRFSPVARI